MVLKVPPEPVHGKRPLGYIISDRPLGIIIEKRPLESINEKGPLEPVNEKRLRVRYRLINSSFDIKFNMLKCTCLIISYIQLIFQAVLLVLVPYMHVHDRVAGKGKMGRNMRVEEIVKISIQYCMMVLTTLFTATLIIGIHKKRPNLVKAFLMYSGIVFFLSFLMCIGVFLYLSRVNEFEIAYQYLLSKIFFFLFHLYCLLIIRTYWCQMVERKESDRNLYLDSDMA